MKVFSLNSLCPSTIHKHLGTLETRRSFQKGTRCTHYNNKLKRKIPTGPPQTTKTCHASFPPTVSSHHVPLLCYHGPSTVRGEHSCGDSRPLGNHTPLPGLTHSICLPLACDKLSHECSLRSLNRVDGGDSVFFLCLFSFSPLCRGLVCGITCCSLQVQYARSKCFLEPNVETSSHTLNNKPDLPHRPT